MKFICKSYTTVIYIYTYINILMQFFSSYKICTIHILSCISFSFLLSSHMCWEWKCSTVFWFVCTYVILSVYTYVRFSKTGAHAGSNKIWALRSDVNEGGSSLWCDLIMIPYIHTILVVHVQREKSVYSCSFCVQYNLHVDLQAYL